jgi:hypothetical protein
LAVAVICCATVTADVALDEGSRDGRTVYVLKNDHVRAVVDAADGGSLTVSLVGDSAEDSAPACRLLTDRISGDVCKYEVDSRAVSQSLAVLSLGWGDGRGLRIEKTVALARSQQTVRVSYRVENGSRRNERLLTATRLEDAQSVTLTAQHEAGWLEAGPATRLTAGGEALEHVVWWGLTGVSERGVVAMAGPGALASLNGRTLPGGGAELQGATALLPAGRALDTYFGLTPQEGFRAPVAATARALCGLDLEKAGRTVRANVRLLPLADLGSGDLVLRITGAEAAALRAPAPALECGRARVFAFLWEPPAQGEYDAALTVPGMAKPLSLGRVSVGPDAAVLKGPAQVADARVELTPVPGWVPEPPEGTEPPGAPDAPQTEPQAAGRLRVNVGIGETETFLIGFGAAEGDEEPAVEAHVPDLSAPRGPAALPGSAMRLQQVALYPAAPGSEPAGILVPLTGPPWRFRGLAAVRLLTPHVAPAPYRGSVELVTRYRAQALETEVRVWPVRRPELGLVRLYVSEPSGDVFSQQGASRGPPPEARGQIRANVSFDMEQVLSSPAARVRLADGKSLPVAAWARRAAGEGGVPALDFSEANPELERLLLAGRRDVTLTGPLTPEALAPPGAPAADGLERAEWFWSGLAAHLRARGFGRLIFIGRTPFAPQDMTEEWFAAARLLVRSGWSVAGPYLPDALEGRRGPRVAELSRIVVVGPAPIGVGTAATDLPAGVQVGVWTPTIPHDYSWERARRLVRELAGEEAVVLVVAEAPPARPPRPARTEETGEQMAPDRPSSSLAWEGVRDGLDEVNYARMAAWYGLSVGPADGAPAKRGLLETLSGHAEAGTEDRIGVYWNDLPLVADGRPEAVIAIDPDFPEQRAQAQLLNEAVRSRCAMVLPVTTTDAVERAGGRGPALLFGSPTTNELIRELARRRTDLPWRLEQNGWMLVEFRRGRRPCLGLLTAQPDQWGRVLMHFVMGLRQEGGWLLH